MAPIYKLNIRLFLNNNQANAKTITWSKVPKNKISFTSNH